MGKTKKRSGKEKDKEFAKNIPEGDIDMKGESPLPKLVLKVGGKEKKQKLEDAFMEHLDGEHSHHKKKKKKHKHKNEVVDRKIKKREGNETTGHETPVKKIQLRVTKETEKAEMYKKPLISPLGLCLENLHRNLQRKDVYGIFTFPVTDAIAPGYSKIIKTPMDFLLMSKKIGNNEYASLDEFRDDFVVMCNNAMLYNGSDTIYYKSAEKMLSLGLKMLARDKLVKLSKSIGVAVSDSEDDIVTVVDSVDSVTTDTVLPTQETMYSPVEEYSPPRRRETRQVSLTASVLASARKAREDLMKKHPRQLYGYLSKDEEGQTSLNILNPDTTEENKTASVKIAKKLESGISPGDAVIKEDKKNKVVPVNYLMYGPYGSFGPAYDSSLSNTTKDESDFLLQSYASETGIEYVKSLMRFTQDSPMARDYVDGVLNALTNGAHMKSSLVAQINEEKEKDKGDKGIDVDKDKEKEKPKEKENEKSEQIPLNVDISSLLTLDGAGIDVTFLKNMVKPKEEEEDKVEITGDNNTKNVEIMKAKLTENANMLETLKQSQDKRLASKYGGVVPLPEREIKTATCITDNLKNLMKMVPPRDIVSSEGVRKAIGTGTSSMHMAPEVESVEEQLKETEVVVTPTNSSTVQENQPLQSPIVPVSQVQDTNENKEYSTSTSMETT